MTPLERFNQAMTIWANDDDFHLIMMAVTWTLWPAFVWPICAPYRTRYMRAKYLR